MSVKKLEFIITKQVLALSHNMTVVENSNNYLEAEFQFLTDDWDNIVSKWASFTKVIKDEKGKETLAEPLPFVISENRIVKEQHLNLSKGKWIICVYGSNDTGMRITTNGYEIQVLAGGVYLGTNIEIPLSYGEQIANLANEAMNAAKKAKELAQEALDIACTCEDGGSGSGVSSGSIGYIEFEIRSDGKLYCMGSHGTIETYDFEINKEGELTVTIYG